MEKGNPNVSRETLYNQVWSVPVNKLAVTYDVSGSYLARICRELNIPTPGRGYWAQLNAGKSPLKDTLPPHRVGDPTMWIRSPTSSRYTDSMPISPEVRTAIPPRRRSPSPHGFLIDAKGLFSKAKTSYSSIYLSPRTQKLVDLVTSLEHLEDTIALAERLFSRLEEYGYRVTIANGGDGFISTKIDTNEIPKKKEKNFYGTVPWRPVPNTVAYVGTVAIGITIVEMTEEVKTTDYPSYTKKIGSGRYRIYAYSPYRHTELVKNWQDTKELKLGKRLDEIIAEMETMARQIPSLILEGEKRAIEESARWEAERREHQRIRDLEIRKEVETESLTDLEGLIETWASLKNKQEFIDELVRAIDKEEAEIRIELLERLNTAKALLGTKSVVDIIKTWETPEERYASLPSWKRYDE